MKRLIKFVGISLLILLGGAAMAYMALNEEKPKGHSPEKADRLAGKMLESINKKAWDSLAYIAWDYNGRHSFVWDKKNNFVEVKWPGFRALLKPDDSFGLVYEEGMRLEGEEEAAALKKAWKYFFNDSFWLNAPAKIFDKGTSRFLVDMEGGKTGLLVSYASGGVTPGDSYLWILDDKNRPTAWKMWVKIIPLGGLEVSWDEWRELPGGAMLSLGHNIKNMRLEIKEVKSGRALSELGLPGDLFKDLE